MSLGEIVWLAVGFGGQALFMMRFVVQWLTSEKQRKSVIPVAFWYFSITGGVTLLTYAIHIEDPVFIVGQSLGVFIYARNLWFIRRHSRQMSDDPKALLAKLA
ncbi:MAG: lipid-A-disaccharide synthase N-terminal domain-containing protein, partial [Pseudomonadota bacterium]|nr:lipid-A-disaccharide synthase N-terminal domain-containing protein [Pseudomonadota bacterium]